jgi:glycosyltransferase involved in cell wall biosynthesis
MATFFSACDVNVLPSVNSTESFGLVQVESMLCGTPVVATDLPGVRMPIQTTKMGRIVPARDAQALAEAVVEIIQHRQQYVQPRETIEHHFPLEMTVKRYESLFEKLIAEHGGKKSV